MPGDSPVNFNLLHRTCKLVVLLCLLHISVTVVFYVRSLDIRFAFAQNQQSQDHVTPSNYVRKSEPKARNEAPAEGQPEPEPQPEEKKTELPVMKLEKCPETSPVLGKTCLLSCLWFQSLRRETRGAVRL